MSNLPEIYLKNRIATSEISVQVEMDTVYGCFTKPNGRFASAFTGQKIELDPLVVHIPSKPKQKVLPVVLTSNRGKSIRFNNSVSDEHLEKKNSFGALAGNLGENDYIRLKKRMNSNYLKTPQQIKSRLKLIVDEISKSAGKKLKQMQSIKKLEKNQSSYQIPPVIDPLSNFSPNMPNLNGRFPSKPNNLYRKNVLASIDQVCLSSAQSRLANFYEKKKNYNLKKLLIK